MSTFDRKGPKAPEPSKPPEAAAPVTAMTTSRPKGIAGVIAERDTVLDEVRYRMTGGARGTPPAGSILSQRRTIIGGAAARILRKGIGAAGQEQGPKGERSAPSVHTAPTGPIVERVGFIMAGAPHAIVATWDNGSLCVMMHSMPRKISAALAEAKQQQEQLKTSLTGPGRLKAEEALAALDGIQSWYDQEEAAIKSQTDKTKIGPGLKKLVHDLMLKIVAVGNKHGLKDFVYQSLGIKEKLDMIHNLVHKELRKHVGDEGVMGDGHNNTAAAAEALGVKTNRGKPIVYSAKHSDRLNLCLTKLTQLKKELDDIKEDYGADTSNEQLYADMVAEIDDCTQAKSDPRAYLAKKGYQVDASGDFKPL